MSENLSFVATCPKGIEEILYQELIGLGVDRAKVTRAGVHFKGSLQTAYRVCLWSRLANRVLMSLKRFRAKTPDDLYDKVYSSIVWDDHMNVNGTLAVDFTETGSSKFHSHYAKIRVKDAIVDQFNLSFGKRPSIDMEQPDIRVNVYLKYDMAMLSLDLSGHSLHRRGYRREGGTAPLKENLAAAVLIRAGWPDIEGKGGPLVDPMCGSGTLLIEAAMMASDKAPGLGRAYFGFLKWKGHDPFGWQELLKEAEERAENGRAKSKPLFFGFDSDKKAIEQARINAAHAGLAESITFDCQDVKALQAPKGTLSGLLITNPPYGERMGERRSLESLYRQLGDRLKVDFTGWQAGVFTANPDLAKHMGIRAVKYYKLYNGAIPCKLLNFEIHASWYMHKRPPGRRASQQAEKPALDSGSEMFANRLRKNLKIIGKWAKKEGISCYRLYDADMPEYAVAIDIYHDWVHVQEYQAPAGVVPENASRRLEQILSVLPEILGLPIENIVLKVRKRTRGKYQYKKFDHSGRFFQVRENGLRFLVNLVDYLDTGLFLDQRIIRQMIRDYSATKRRMLNLFCYTGTATVYAAAGRAVYTTSVDLSHTYLSWAEKNFTINGLSRSRHHLIQADCLEWLEGCQDRYDLIFLAPPTFSNSKRMKRSFDVQRDHVGLLKQVMKLLTHDGLLIFSSNRRRFKLDREALSGWNVKDISRVTIPRDFERKKQAHHCFEIRR